VDVGEPWFPHEQAADGGWTFNWLAWRRSPRASGPGRAPWTPFAPSAPTAVSEVALDLLPTARSTRRSTSLRTPTRSGGEERCLPPFLRLPPRSVRPAFHTRLHERRAALRRRVGREPVTCARDKLLVPCVGLVEGAKRHRDRGRLAGGRAPVRLERVTETAVGVAEGGDRVADRSGSPPKKSRSKRRRSSTRALAARNWPAASTSGVVTGGHPNEVGDGRSRAWADWSHIGASTGRRNVLVAAQDVVRVVAGLQSLKARE
jgi:hypothetical protein